MPLTLYSIHEARNFMEGETKYPYDIEAVRKAVRQGTINCNWMGQEPVFTRDQIMAYLWYHARHKPQLPIPTNEEVEE